MESIYTVCTEYDVRDLFPILPINAQRNHARRFVHRMIRDEFGIVLDADMFDGTEMPDDHIIKPLYYGACIAYRRLYGWAVYGDWVHMTHTEVANNFNLWPIALIA